MLIDLVKGMWDNLRYAKEYQLIKLYELTFHRLNKGSERELQLGLMDYDDNRQLFYLLMRVNADIDWELLSLDGFCLLSPLEIVYDEYRKYERLRKKKQIRILKLLINNIFHKK